MAKLPPDWLSDEILRGMGLVVAHWGALEALLDSFILRHQGIPIETGALLTSHLTFSGKAKLCLTFANESQDDAVKAELTAITKEANSLYKARNRVVHAFWHKTDNPKKALVRTIRASGTLREIQIEVHHAQLEADAERMFQLGGRLRAFMEANDILPKDSE